MLDAVRKGFREAKLRLQGHGTLNEEVIGEAIAEIRQSLLEADVDPEVAGEFLDKVGQRAVGEVVKLRAGKGKKKRRVRPADHFVSICNEELTALLGEGVPSDPLVLPKGKTSGVLVMGLQGSGKTTSVGKLASWLLKRGRKPMMVAADTYRPAAAEQLKVLGERLEVPVFHKADTNPVDLCVQGMAAATAAGCDVVLFDTAGRLAIDDALMTELEHIREATQPVSTLFVCDAMIGQDAVRTAATFHERLPFDGVILTKLDGDARGGAALSIRRVTGAPILFTGVGEDLDRLEVFRAEGMASRVLGMGDIVGLMEEFSEVVDEDQAEADARRMMRGNFSFNDFLEQLRMLQRMGPLGQLLDKVPFLSDAMPDGLNVDDRQLMRVESMIQSMTRAERNDPELINDSRIHRIANGSGRSKRDVRDLVQRFETLRDMLRKMGMGASGNRMGFGQMAALRKMRQQGMQGLSMADLQAGAGVMGRRSAARKRARDPDREKAKRKAARNARKRNRKGGKR
jgi:signal recognition particle subunit SRP54